MTERRQITETVHYWDEDFDIPAKDFVRQLTDLIAMVPEPFRDALQLEFDCTGSDYDYSRGEMSLYYKRRETDEEMQERDKVAVATKKYNEQREREMLAALKAKYER